MSTNTNRPLLYDNLESVRALNKVDGFDPRKFLRTTPDGPKLDLKYKKLWFRLAHPAGRVKVIALKITEQLAIMEARVYFNKEDTEPVASCLTQRYASDHQLYIEAAQHAAADQALSDAGFGVQFNDTRPETKFEVAGSGAKDVVATPTANTPPEAPAEEAAPPVSDAPPESAAPPASATPPAKQPPASEAPAAPATRSLCPSPITARPPVPERAAKRRIPKRRRRPSRRQSRPLSNSSHWWSRWRSVMLRRRRKRLDDLCGKELWT